MGQPRLLTWINGSAGRKLLWEFPQAWASRGLAGSRKGDCNGAGSSRRETFTPDASLSFCHCSETSQQNVSWLLRKRLLCSKRCCWMTEVLARKTLQLDRWCPAFLMLFSWYQVIGSVCIKEQSTGQKKHHVPHIL